MELLLAFPWQDATQLQSAQTERKAIDKLRQHVYRRTETDASCLYSFNLHESKAQTEKLVYRIRCWCKEVDRFDGRLRPTGEGKPRQQAPSEFAAESQGL